MKRVPTLRLRCSVANPGRVADYLLKLPKEFWLVKSVFTCSAFTFVSTGPLRAFVIASCGFGFGSGSQIHWSGLRNGDTAGEF